MFLGPVLTATGLINGRRQFSTPHRIRTPDRSPKNLVQVITLAAHMTLPNLVQIRPWGLLGKWVKYNENLFIYLVVPFFGNIPTGQTRQQIFTHGGSNDADLHKNVRFGSFIDIAPHHGSEIPFPKTLIFRA